MPAGRLDLGQAAVVTGDRELLRRACENVLRNAIRHAACREPPSRSNSRQRDGLATITIRDHGPGVPPEVLQEIFKPFYRVETDRDRSSGGTGLGLAIAHRAVLLHQGRMTARNANPGLIVEIELPIGNRQGRMKRERHLETSGYRARETGRCQSRARLVCKTVCGMVTALIGVSTLAGWITGQRLLSGVRPDYIPMAPNTAIGFLLLGITVVVIPREGEELLAEDRGRRSCRLCCRPECSLSLLECGPGRRPGCSTAGSCASPPNGLVWRHWDEWRSPRSLRSGRRAWPQACRRSRAAGRHSRRRESWAWRSSRWARSSASVICIERPSSTAAPSIPMALNTAVGFAILGLGLIGVAGPTCIADAAVHGAVRAGSVTPRVRPVHAGDRPAYPIGSPRRSPGSLLHRRWPLPRPRRW